MPSISNKKSWLHFFVVLVILIFLLSLTDIAEAKHKSKKSGDKTKKSEDKPITAHTIEEVKQELAKSIDEEAWIVPTTSKEDKEKFKSKGCKIRHELHDATAIRCPKGFKTQSAEAMPVIQNAEPDKVYHLLDIDADAQINADKVWDLGYDGSGVTVALLDGGVDAHHPELADSIAGGKGFGFDTFEDDNSHGTHVSGIITANGINPRAKGVAPSTKIWMAKVCSADGLCHVSDMIAAIEYIVDNNIAKIISISIGGDGTDKPDCDHGEGGGSVTLVEKVNWAVSKGVSVVAGAGNTAGVVADPGCASGAIAVGSVTKRDGDSGTGTGLALDIMAPGSDIFSTLRGGRYGALSGTSMATPHVSATIALLRQIKPDITDAQIKDALYSTAKDLGDPGFDIKYGHGRVDALKAVSLFLPPVHDVAVKDLQVSPSITKGSLVPVKVNVMDKGTFDEAFTVTLTDVEEGSLIGSRQVNLQAFSSQELSFDWDTSKIGTGRNTLKAEAIAVPEETRLDDNVKTAIVDVEEAALSKLHIENIIVSVVKSAKNAKAVITVFTADNKPVGNALVSGNWSGATKDKDAGTTSDKGKVTFASDKVKKTAGKTFTFCVDNVIKEGFVYDKSADKKKCVSSRALEAVSGEGE